MNSTSSRSQNQTAEEVFIVQNTSISAPAPVRHPGRPPHGVVFALPLEMMERFGQVKYLSHQASVSK